MRKKILDMPYAEWKRMGYSKGTLHYLKRNAKSDKPFKMYGKGREKLLRAVYFTTPIISREYKQKV